MNSTLKWLFTPLVASMALVPIAAANSNSGEAGNYLLNNPDKLAEVAAAFGLSTETLTAEIQSGETLREIAIEYQVGRDVAGEYIKQHSPHPLRRPEVLKALADSLGITVDEVKAALQDKTLEADLEAKLGVDLKTYLKDMREDWVSTHPQGTHPGHPKHPKHPKHPNQGR